MGDSMPIEMRTEHAGKVIAWAGWDSTLLDALLDAESGPHAVGFTLARVLASRLLPSPTARFCFRLYRYAHEDGGYRFVGAWNESCLEEGAVAQPSELLERREGLAPVPDPGTSSDQFHESELFLPLETKNGVLGFGVLRVDSQHVPLEVGPGDLHFLGRLGGSALGRLNESDRAVRMHRSFESAARHLDAVLSLTSEAIVLVDVQGIVRIANEPALRLLRPTQGLLGRSIGQLLPPGAADLLHQALLEAEESEERISAEIPLEREGMVVSVQVTVQQLQSDLELAPTLLVRFRAGGGQAWGGVLDPAVPAGALDEAEAMRRGVRSLRSYLGLGPVAGSGRFADQPPQLAAQLERLQNQADLHAQLEAIRCGRVRWQDRPIRIAALLERALAKVGVRLALREISVVREFGPEPTRVRLDVEKWSLAIAILVDRAAEQPGVRRIVLSSTAVSDLDVILATDPAGAVAGVFDGGDAGDSGLTFLTHLLSHHAGSLTAESRLGIGPVVRVRAVLEADARSRRHAA